MQTTVVHAALAALCCATLATPSVAVESQLAPRGAPTCSEAWQEVRLGESERLELIVDLAYHSMQSRQPGLRLSGPQNAVLGLLIDEACRQSPEAGLGTIVDLAVRIALDAHPEPRAALAAH